MNYIIAAIGIATLIYDGWLASQDKTTISQWCQALFPSYIDWIIGISGWIGLCVVKYFWPEFNFTLGVIISGFWGHIWLANKERWHK